MSVLDELERSLARAVDAGAAAGDGSPTRAPRGRFVRLRPRRAWHVFVGILVAGGVTTGALAATGQFKVVREGNPNYLVMNLPGYDGKPVAPPRLLSLRVRDPEGGPPWALRTFRIGRGTVCAQAGQLYQGKFGIVTRDPDGRTVFQIIPAAVPVVGARCGPEREGGLPIVASRESVVFGGPGAIPACGSGRSTSGPCSVTRVRIVRWGFLGPKAGSATFIHASGRRGTEQKLDAENGGAYLFVEDVDPAPTRASAEFEVALRKKIDARYPRVPYGSIPKAERREADRKWRERTRYVTKVSRAARPERRRLWTGQLGESVSARFAGGETRQVAGRGSKGGPLPGVAPLSQDVPKVPRAKVSVNYRQRTRAVEVRFASPVALDRTPGRYVITVRGPRQPSCGAHLESAWAEYARETPRGEAILVRVRPTVGGRRARPSWCAGRSYTARVRHITSLPGGGRNREIDQLVGTDTFVAR